MIDVTMPPAHPERRVRKNVRIVPLSAASLAALAAGDARQASSHAPIRIPEWFIAGENSRLWALRSRQGAEDPAAVDWLTGAAADLDSGLVIGFAGYHAPPDAAGLVEIGYDVGRAYRRRGFAHGIIEALLERARREPQVRTVRATISPANTVSRALALAHGFVITGEQWDDTDGLEIIYEATAVTPED